MNLSGLLVLSAVSGPSKAVPCMWKYSQPKHEVGSKKGHGTVCILKTKIHSSIYFFVVPMLSDYKTVCSWRTILYLKCNKPLVLLNRCGCGRRKRRKPVTYTLGTECMIPSALARTGFMDKLVCFTGIENHLVLRSNLRCWVFFFSFRKILLDLS